MNSSTTNHKPPITKLFLLVFLIRAFCVPLLFAGLIASSANCQSSRIARVTRVIDGDTFVIGTNERVRLLGVDTPELNSQDSVERNLAYIAFGKTREMIDGRIVKLTFDGNRKDVFGRTLAYAFVQNKQGKDSLFIQAELLNSGLARILMYPKQRIYYALFYNLRNTARKYHLGIWSK
jgi:micrococcal nuclease